MKKDHKDPAILSLWYNADIMMEYPFVTTGFRMEVNGNSSEIKPVSSTGHPVDKSTGLKYDQTVMLITPKSLENYPDKLRRVKYFDAEKGKLLIFLTNNFLLPALTIAMLYKSRWQIEIFFKWIKQHLRIKSFYGTSENAVKTQIWIAISIYVLVAIIKKRLNLDLSLYTILQIFSVTLFEKVPLIQLLTNFDYKNCAKNETYVSNQLTLFDF